VGLLIKKGFPQRSGANAAFLLKKRCVSLFRRAAA
jgi:hypothetical protein